MIHEHANASSLGLLRVIVFGSWAILPIWEWLPGLAQLPVEVFSGPGPLAMLPSTVSEALISPVGLWMLGLLVVCGSTVVAVGLFPHRGFAFAVSLLILLEQGVVRGFSGHINHAELVLAYVAVSISVFPIFDGLSIRRPDAAPHAVVMYRAPFLIAMLIFTVSFSFVGAARISEGFDLFNSETLRNLLAGRWIRNSVNIADGSLGSTPFYLEPSFAGMLRLSYVASTLVELLAPLALVSRVTRLGFVWFALTFHAINLLAVGVPFYENIIVLVVFSEIWFHRIAKRLDGGWAPSIDHPLSQST